MAIWFQAGVNIREVEPDFKEGHVHVHFGAETGSSWDIEYRPVLGGDDLWISAGRSIVGQDTFVEFVHDLSPGNRRFYRVIGNPVIP